MGHYSSTNNNLSFGLLAFIGGVVFGSVIMPKVKTRLKNSEAWQDLKAEVEYEAKKVKDMTQEKYNKLVDEVSTRFSKLRKISSNEMQDIVTDIKMHWERIKDTWENEEV